jgi:RNA polymerase sigma-70 factor (ECF subfamily)
MRRAADWTRRRQRDRRLASAVAAAGPPPPTASPDLEPDEQIGRLRAALRRLPADRRALLALLYLDGASVSLIALILQIPPGTVKSRLHHARRELRDSMERMTHVEH